MLIGRMINETFQSVNVHAAQKTLDLVCSRIATSIYRSYLLMNKDVSLRNLEFQLEIPTRAGNDYYKIEVKSKGDKVLIMAWTVNGKISSNFTLPISILKAKGIISSLNGKVIIHLYSSNSGIIVKLRER